MSVNQPSPDSNEEELKKREAENAMRQRALTFLLDQNARQRLANIRMVKPELAMTVDIYLINSDSYGRLN